MSGKVAVRGLDALASEGPVSIHVFSSDRIEEIHQRLVIFFSTTEEPIRDLGLRDPSLLEQAIAHQFSGGVDDHHPLEKAAALFQGLFDELPFHDGNAQTAFLALLLQLDDNGYVPNRVSFDDFFEFCSAIHERRMPSVRSEDRRSPGKRPATGLDDSELALILRWLKAHTRVEPVRDHPLSLGELKRMLLVNGFEVGEEKTGSLDIKRLEADPPRRLFGMVAGRKVETQALCRIPVPQGEGLVPLTVVRDVRQACGSSAEAFYDWRARLDSFMHQHRTLLVRLGRI
jgi:prophage maintenance system killer protein